MRFLISSLFIALGSCLVANACFAYTHEVSSIEGRKSPVSIEQLEASSGWRSQSSVNLSPLKNKVVVFDFSASWCHACRTFGPMYEEIAKKYNSAAFEYIGVFGPDEHELEYIRGSRFSYPVIIDQGNLLNDSFQVPVLPTLVMIDKAGIVRFAGYMKPEEFELNLRRLLR